MAGALSSVPSTPVDPRQPVVVGVAQATQQDVSVADASEPVQLMTDVVADAAGDAGSARLLAALELVVVVRGAWSYSDPGRLVAERLGASKAATALTAEGGNAPQAAVNQVCRRIAEGSLDVAVVVGGEGIYTRRKARQLGSDRTVTRQSGVEPDERWGDDRSMSGPLEHAIGFTAPVHYYALFENALRAARSETHDEHRDRIAGLLAGFNAVAVGNPLAWSRQPLTRQDIRDPGPDNRMVAYPYTKRMCSNWFTDQAAAVLLCSARAAADLGVPRDRWVFPCAGTDGNDTYHVTNRASLATSPAIRHAGSSVLELAGAGVDDVAHVDVYSCFPSAVQVAAAELGLGDHRSLTLTGGMAYFGGPLSNYVTHSVATMATALRDDPDALGLVTANGGYLTKHSFGVYSGAPPRSGYRWADVQPVADGPRPVPAAAGHDGQVGIEATTVAFADPDRPVVLAACRTPSGARCWARSAEDHLVTAATTTELAGIPARVSPTGELWLEG